MKRTYRMRNILLKHKLWLVLIIVSAGFMALQEVLKAYVMQYILDAAVHRSMQELKTALFLAVMALLCVLVVYLMHHYCKERFVQKCMVSLKEQWFDSIQKKELSEYDSQKSGEWLGHFTSDAEMLQQDYLENFFGMVESIIVGIASLVVIVKIHYAFLIFIVATFWIPVAANQLFAKRLEASKKEVSKANGIFVGKPKELLEGFEVTKLYRLTKKMRGSFQTVNEKREETQFCAQYTDDAAEICSFAGSLLIWLGSYLLGAWYAVRGLMTTGEILNAAQLLNNVVNPLYSISGQWMRMKAADGVYREISEKLDRQSEDVQEERLESLTELPKEICFQNISLKQMERTIFEDVNLRMESGKKYLVTGESGSGKSSLIKILLNIYTDYTGNVLLAGKNYRELAKDSWYQYISVVGQDSFVFQDTVYQNITLFDTYPEEEVQRVVKLCCLDEFVKHHENGLEYRIEENGRNISGGERQRICLARALIRRPKILILDEATSALNQEMAHQIEANVLSLEDTMVLAVSHRVFEDLKNQYDAEIHFDGKTACIL